MLKKLIYFFLFNRRCILRFGQKNSFFITDLWQNNYSEVSSAKVFKKNLREFYDLRIIGFVLIISLMFLIMMHTKKKLLKEEIKLEKLRPLNF